MRIGYTNIREELEKKGIQSFPELGMFLNNGNVIKVTQWQPKGELCFTDEEGFKSTLPEHEDKCRKFLQYASEASADIVISPEYSTPFSTLKYILDNKKDGPKSGKLWCLGMEGISCSDMEKFVEEVGEKEHVCLIIEDLQELNQNHFFSSMVYLFRAERKLVCVCQLKTTAAADKGVEFESRGLTLGHTIYYFVDENRRNYLFSFICADALNQELIMNKEQMPYQQCLILHPQLNPKPLHDSFNLMRQNFLDFSNKTVRIISVNWAKNTCAKCKDDTEVTTSQSYSAFYNNRVLSDKDMTELLVKNKPKGIHFAKKDHVNIWYMNETEHVVSYSIDSFESNNLNNVAATHQEPVGNKYLEYNQEQKAWESKFGCVACPIDWEWLKEVFNLEQCDCRNCGVVALHLFFAILFCQNKYADLNLDKEQSAVVFNTNEEAIEEIIRFRERSKSINEEIQAGNLPTKFSDLLERGFHWILDSEGNLIYNDGCDKLCVACVDVENEDVIKKRIAQFERLMGKAATDRLILYSLTGKGWKCYEKMYNTSINKPELTHSMDTFK